MNSRRTTICRVITSGIALGAFALPGPALANPLLSGYGGPGQGAQVILGGTLLNTPGGGSGANPGSSTASELTVATASGAASTPTARARPAHRHAATGGSSPSTAAPSPAKPVDASLQRLSSGGSGGALGLSGGDLLLVLFALAALTATGMLTRQLTRRPLQE